MSRDSHDTRCERSGSKASRCRCQCQGRLHGDQATHLDLGDHRLGDDYINQQAREFYAELDQREPDGGSTDG